MSRQLRYRITAVVLGGLLLGVPLLTNGTASAGQVEPRDGQVVFAGGGRFGLSCESSPDVESVHVPAGSTVTVVNHTGHDARLMLGGKEHGTLRADRATRVVFRRGTTRVSLDPDCPFDDQAAPALVTAVPVPDPSDTQAGATATPFDSGSPDVTAGGVPLASPGVPTSTPHRTAAAPARVVKPRSIKPKRIKTRPATRPSHHKTGVDKLRAPSVPKPVVTLPTTAPPTAAVTAPPSEIAAAEPLAPLPTEQPIGLLALVAAVCILGVGLGATRAFIAERAFATKIA